MTSEEVDSMIIRKKADIAKSLEIAALIYGPYKDDGTVSIQEHYKRIKTIADVVFKEIH